jgi:hypothetical protein
MVGFMNCISYSPTFGFVFPEPDNTIKFIEMNTDEENLRCNPEEDVISKMFCATVCGFHWTCIWVRMICR